MRRLLSAILSLLIALHAVLGCCWHHAHGEPTASDGWAWPHLHVHDHGECGHGQELPTHGDRDPADDCDEASCVFVRGELSWPSDGFGEAQSAMLSGDQITSVDAGIALIQRFESHHSLAPPLRLHLRLSVLLI